MANYLVTGAAGFIGAAVTKKLLADGHNVVSIDNLSTGTIESIPKGTVFIEGDCSAPEVYTKIPQHQYHAILHIAGQSSGEISFDDPIYDIRTNTESTLLLLKFALKNSCKRFIYAGTMSVYGDKQDRPIKEDEECNPQSFYGVGKLASEHYMRIYEQYGINSTSLRLFNVYGPGQNLNNMRQGMVSIFMAQMINNHSILVKGASERYRDFVFIDDVVNIFIKAIDEKMSFNKVINVGTGVKTTIKQLLAALCDLHNETVQVEYKGNTSGDVHGIFASIDELERVFGLTSLTKFKVGLEQMYKWARHD
tara:strand:- start:10415 stop:11338 length:924 start_codon:yes stop_codon:yes gene_type:complete